MTTITENPQYTGESPVLRGHGFSKEAVETINELSQTPAWLNERRLAAWERFEATPMPTSRDEKWRFTNLRGIDVQKVRTVSGCDGAEAAAVRAETALSLNEGTAGRVVATNGAIWGDKLTADTLPEGVIFQELTVAANEHSDLVQKHFGSVVPAEAGPDEYFAMLQEATLSAGVFLYVPRNTKVDLPFRADVVHAIEGGHVNWRVLVVLEEGAEATFVEEYTSAESAESGFSNAVVELVAGAGSHLHYVTVQDYAVPMTHFATHRVNAARDSQVDWVAVGLGSSRGKSRMEAVLSGPGANVKLTGAYVLGGRQELDYDTYQQHAAPNTYSDLAFKGVLADKSKSVWRGMIAVDRGAQGTDAYQENRNLLLHNGCHADSIPGLQILANEVRCTHGATIAKVEPEQLFYLMARGLSREAAVQLLVRGFFAPILARVADETLREQLQEALWSRMESAATTAAIANR